MATALYPILNAECGLPYMVTGIGIEENQQHILRKEGFYAHQIFFCVRGRGKLCTDGCSFEIEPNDFFCLPQGVPHEYYGITGVWELLWVSFMGYNCGNLLDALGLTRVRKRALSSMHTVRPMFHKIFAALKFDQQQGAVRASGLLYAMLTEICADSRPQKTAASAAERVARTVTDYIDAHFFEEFTLDALAKLAGVTPEYLCRVFKSAVSLRPFEYLTLKRIQMAKSLLTGTALSVAEIARRVGYHDSSYFCAQFRKLELCSPSEFRGRK